MIWLVLHHFLGLYDEVWSGLDDEALKSLVVTACILLWLSA